MTTPDKPQKRIIRVAVGSTNPVKIRAVEEALEKSLHPPPPKTRTSMVMNGHGTKNTDAATPVDETNGSAQDDFDPALGPYTFDIQAFHVSSGVPSQPMGDAQTQEGAKNRAKAAYKAYLQANGNFPHLAFGVEGGLEWISMTTKSIDASSNGDAGTSENNDDNGSKKTGVQNGDGGNKPASLKLYCMAWMVAYGKREGFLLDAIAHTEIKTYSSDRKPVVGMAKAASLPIPEPVAKLVVEQGMELGDADDKVFGRKNSKQGSGTVGVLTNGLVDRSSYYEHALLLCLTPWLRPDLYPNGHGA